MAFDYPHILRNYIYPLSQSIRKRDYLRMMDEASHNQFLSREELMSIQFEKLAKLVRHAIETVPYYQRTYREKGIHPEDIKTWDDYKKLPTLSKDQYRENYKEFISTQPSTPLYTMGTSGSTGIPTNFFLDQNSSAAANISRIRALQWWGIKLGEREMRMWGDISPLMPDKLAAIKRRWKRFYSDRLMNRRTFSANTISEEYLEELWRFMRHYRPEYIFGYAMFIFSFASYIHNQGHDGTRLGLKAAIVSAENLFDSQFETIRNVFNCPVVNEYGSTECGVIAYDHPCGEFHMMDDFLVSEIIKPNPEDEYGELVVTPLENWGSPLIRYNLQDLVTPADTQGNCSLNLGLSSIKNILGRNNDLIRLPDGRLVHGNTIATSMKFLPNIHQFQIVQNKTDSLQMLLVTELGKLSADEEDYLRGKLRENMGGIEIDFILVEEIPREDSGKFRFIRSEIQD
jgi:phenylacetate-CoA ligase